MAEEHARNLILLIRKLHKEEVVSVEGHRYGSKPHEYNTWRFYYVVGKE